MEFLSGKCAYEGIVIGEIYVEKDTYLEPEKEIVSFDEISTELQRFQESLKKAELSLVVLKNDLDGKIDKKELSMIDAHILLLRDPLYISDIKKCIQNKQKKSEYAIIETTEKFIKLFENIDSPIYRQRGLDIKDVCNRLLDTLKSENEGYKNFHNKILITKEIYPTKLLKLHRDGIHIKGIIMEYGGETSHVAILAKALKIPTLMGVADIFSYNWSETVILDTTEEAGYVITNPSNEDILNYELKQREFKERLKTIKDNSYLPSVTKDGIPINLYLNLGDSNHHKLKEVDRSRVSGVGLLRTELLYMNRSKFPSEDTQFKIYKDVLKDFSKEQPIIIRTLDIGADKQLSYFQMQNETNPFLGLRGIRFSLENKEIFKTQLRAILRLSAEKNIKIMYPMITSILEVREANTILNVAKSELKNENVPFNENIEVGIMVEVPSVVMMAEAFAKEVDFFSVGTNDLTQYILATDRLSETVNNLYSGYNPAVLRAIYHLKKAADKYNKKISVCGELASESKAIVALLSMGIKDLSMVETSILHAKFLIRNLNYKEIQHIRDSILECDSAEEVENILKKHINF
ncbi:MULTISPECIES: phosphoenolpyruvate--protein phosphotransferase [unclassified Fusobacterium]|uniref:phosphoenolpyruvate--protein phosphotransferase n=1 Tax=Fusobacterium sp. TaxID=68766 RepID=UPI0025C1CC32|nr:phosphoenolpyruvate--protein phosphotransferase [Fusobacterium sp.]